MSDSENAPFFIPNEKIILTKNGIWLSDGIEITHDGSCALFFRSIKKDARGYFLEVGREQVPIEIEDTAYFVTRISGASKTGFSVQLSDGCEEELIPTTLKYKPGRLSCMVKQGMFEAKFLLNSYMELLGHLEENQNEYYLKIQGQAIALAKKK